MESSIEFGKQFGQFLTENQGSEKNKFKCGKCLRNYNSKYTLRRHEMYECGKEPRFQCPFCQRKAKQKSNIQQHISMCHFDKIKEGATGI